MRRTLKIGYKRCKFSYQPLVESLKKSYNMLELTNRSEEAEFRRWTNPISSAEVSITFRVRDFTRPSIT